jgi:hypothetical protein
MYLNELRPWNITVFLLTNNEAYPDSATITLVNTTFRHIILDKVL